MIESNKNLGEFEEKGLGKLIAKYMAYWRLFATGLVVALLAVFLYLRYWSETQYEIRSTILVKDKDAGQGPFRAEDMKNLGLIKTSHSVEDEMGILSSIGIMEKVISNRSLNINFYIEGNIRDVEIYGEDSPVRVLVDETASMVIYDLPVYIELLGENRYELQASFDGQDYRAEHGFGDLVTAPFGTFTITAKIGTKYIDQGKPLYFVIRNTDKVIDTFLQNLNIELVDMNGDLLNIRFLCNNKKKGEDVVASLIETYVEEMIKYENELAENTIKMIDERVKLLSGEISGVEKTVEEFKTRNDLTNVNSSTDIYIQQANDYKKMIADYQSQINVLESIEYYLKEGELNSQIPNALSYTDASLRNIIDQYNETLLEKKRLSQSASSNNPVIVNLDTKLNDLGKAILGSVRSAKSGLTIAQRNLQANANKYDAQIAKVPSMERQLLDISRQQSTKEGLYLYLLQKREEEVLSLAAPVSSTRIVSLPRASIYPVSPNKKLFYLAGLLLGLFMPFSIIYVKDALNNKITTIEDLAEAVTAPFLGEIARSGENEVLVAEEKEQSPMSELFRLLCFNLDHLKKTEKNQTLLVTSTVKGEGKTFIASNLAVTLASNGEKIVVLSFDLREPELMKKFDLPNSPGIIDFILKKEIDVNHIIQKHPTIENLYLIGAGALVTQVGRLMLSGRISILMEALKKNFNRIIIDSAPIGNISDAFALNAYIDSTIYVVRKDVTKKEHLKTIESIYKDGKLKNTMVLLNATDAAQTYGYGYGSNNAKS